MPKYHQSQLSVRITEFRKQMNLPIGKWPMLLKDEQLEFYQKFVAEEMEELRIAHENQDIVGCADALADLIYLLHGCTQLMGLPIDDILEAVHDANMRKAAGRSKRGDNDVTKPQGWVGPEEKIRSLIHEC